MEFRNPKIPEGINVSKEHPLKSFLVLFAIVVGVLAVIFVVLSFSIGKLVKLVPFEAEVSIAENIADNIVTVDSDFSIHDKRATIYLQNLSNKLSQAQKLPEGMQITVHYIKEPVINAFATLGGHIIIYQGLIDALSSENALAMVLSHEIAHVKHRHPITAMSRSASIALLLSLAGLSDSGLISSLGGQMSLFTALAFSRKQETESDITAFDTLINHYGHGQGASELFAILKKSEGRFSQPELFSSHPLKEKRIKRLKALEASSSVECSQSTQGCRLTSLPEFMQNPTSTN